MKVFSIITITLSALVALSSGSFQKKNALDAIALEKEFAKLTKDSPCKENDVACIEGAFAKCHTVLKDGKFVQVYSIQPCGTGTTCCVLPLVLKRGTSVTCDTPEDRDRRIKAALDTVDPPKSNNSNNSKDTPPTTPPTTPSPPTDRAEIRKENARKAEELTEKFKTFTVDTPCVVNDVACINDNFALCAPQMENGVVVNKFVIMSCGSGLKCVALPLVNKPGTTVTCSTEADREARLDQARKNL